MSRKTIKENTKYTSPQIGFGILHPGVDRQVYLQNDICRLHASSRFPKSKTISIPNFCGAVLSFQPSLRTHVKRRVEWGTCSWRQVYLGTGLRRLNYEY